MYLHSFGRQQLENGKDPEAALKYFRNALRFGRPGMVVALQAGLFDTYRAASLDRAALQVAHRTLRKLHPEHEVRWILAGASPPAETARELDRAEALVEAARQLVEAGHHAIAAELCRGSLPAAPASALNLQGILHFGIGEIEEASRCFERSLQVDPGHLAAGKNRVCLQLDYSDEREQALSLARRLALAHSSDRELQLLVQNLTVDEYHPSAVGYESLVPGPRQGGEHPPIRVVNSVAFTGTIWLMKMVEQAGLEKYAGSDDDLFAQRLAPLADHAVFLGYRHYRYSEQSRKLDPKQHPGLRMVLLLRNPLDHALACLRHHQRHYFALPNPSASFKQNYLSFIDGSLEHYQDHVISWIQSGSVLPVRYEELINRPRSTLRRLLAHLEVDCSEQRLNRIIQDNFHYVVDGDTIDRYPRREVVSELDKGSTPGEWRCHLDEHDLRALRPRIGSFLEFLGYRLEL
jgi:tetratricopeptide (TPR) repeat protein